MMWKLSVAVLLHLLIAIAFLAIHLFDYDDYLVSFLVFSGVASVALWLFIALDVVYHRNAHSNS